MESKMELELKLRIVDNISMYRRMRGYSKRQLASLIGIDEKQVRRLEDPNYKFLPTLTSLCKVATALDVSVQDLMI